MGAGESRIASEAKKSRRASESVIYNSKKSGSVVHPHQYLSMPLSTKASSPVTAAIPTNGLDIEPKKTTNIVQVDRDRIFEVNLANEKKMNTSLSKDPDGPHIYGTYVNADWLISLSLSLSLTRAHTQKHKHKHTQTLIHTYTHIALVRPVLLPILTVTPMTVIIMGISDTGMAGW